MQGNRQNGKIFVKVSFLLRNHKEAINIEPYVNKNVKTC